VKTADAKSKPTAGMYLDALVKKLTAEFNAPTKPVGDVPKQLQSDGSEE